MRLNTVNASIGRVQLKHLDDINSRKREIAEQYRKNLSEDILLKENPKGKSVYHQIVIKHSNRDKIIDHLSKNDIGTMIHYPIPIHKQPLYKNLGYSLLRAESFCQKIVSLPSHSLLSNEDVKIVCEKINEVLA